MEFRYKKIFKIRNVTFMFQNFEKNLKNKIKEIHMDSDESINLFEMMSNHKPLFVSIFMTINVRFVILWDFEFFEKRTW